ncbi:MAG TPA: hypothetical protein VN969_10610 [Streptosporangiaceae bacterium]|nr:hypothetical protein [Streptosporangiaceae bacterium]
MTFSRPAAPVSGQGGVIGRCRAAGASPCPVTIGLPAGKFGRPALQLTEDWTQTDAALLVLNQADRESLALLVLILVVCARSAGAGGRW